jgi:hypothetical protein
MVRSFKSAVTNRIGKIPDAPTTCVWQRNYHEHIIRDEAELGRFHEYIEANPARWAEDDENVLKP